MQNYVVDSGKLKEYTTKLFLAAGLAQTDAQAVSELLVHADLRNVRSHGVLRTVPYLEKIQEKFKKKNIFFVSIAIDLNKKEWIQFLEQNPLKGTQLVFDRKWLSFVHYYQVTTIPRYILLDKEGKVVHLDMPRPSNPEFEKILKSLKGL